MLYGTFKQLLRVAEMMGKPENCSLETMDASGYRLDRIRISGKTLEGIQFQLDMSLSGEPVKEETLEDAPPAAFAAPLGESRGYGNSGGISGREEASGRLPRPCGNRNDQYGGGCAPQQFGMIPDDGRLPF